MLNILDDRLENGKNVIITAKSIFRLYEYIMIMDEALQGIKSTKKSYSCYILNKNRRMLEIPRSNIEYLSHEVSNSLINNLSNDFECHDQLKLLTTLTQF